MAIALFSCGEKKSSEEEIEDFFLTIEEHLENRNTGRLKKFIADTYSDKYNHDKSDLTRIAAGYLLRHQSVHLMHNIIAIDVNNNDSTANITLDVAVSPEPLSVNDLRLLRGDFHRFEVSLVREGEWLLQSLVWQHITADEFISGIKDFPPTEG